MDLQGKKRKDMKQIEDADMDDSDSLSKTSESSWSDEEQEKTELLASQAAAIKFAGTADPATPIKIPIGDKPPPRTPRQAQSLMAQSLAHPQSPAIRSPMASPKLVRLEQLERKETARREREHTRAVKMAKEAKLRELRDAQNKSIDQDAKQGASTRLQFLINQADIYTHFVGGRTPARPRNKATEDGEDVSMIPAQSQGSQSQFQGDEAHHRVRMTDADQDRELMDEVEEHQSIAGLTVQPACISGKMREYQLAGLNWLLRRYENGINAILADEMGLGKTLQTISLLGYLKNALGVHGPHLVIAPKSTLGNWMKEVSRWCPSLRPVKLLGGKEERADTIENELIAGKFDVCVTSYEVAIIEKSSLKKFAWRYLVVDEAHRIKNEKSVLSVVVRLFRAQFRLLLTGTPLQNNLRELWALLNFLLPDVFSNAEDFESWFDFEKEKDGGKGKGKEKEKEDGKSEGDVIRQLHKVLRPFLLRRLKADVEKGLPPKKEITLFVSMSSMQRTWYKNILSRNIDAINSSTGKQTRLLNILMQLRKVCNHPYMFDGAEPGPPYIEGEHLVDNCGKLSLLDKLLGRLKQDGHRVLIFSQMTRMLDILDDYCTYRGYEYCRIDGSTDHDDRERQIEEYNAEGSSKFVFLLSTRAGGLGINLATADTVIIYDSDWNPQVDLQAMDRCHRIGQKKSVRVYRLVVDPSIENKIVERAEKKLKLDALVIQSGRLIENRSLSKDEMLAMIRHGADAAFRADGDAVTDEDIDAILARGEKLSDELAQKMEKAAADRFQLSLDTGVSMYEFEGVDYSERKEDTVDGIPQLPEQWIELDKRERKKGGYSEAQYYRSVLSGGGSSQPRKAGPRRPKPPATWDHQFFDRRMNEIYEIEEAHYNKMMERAEKDEYKASEDPGALSEELQQEKEALMESGFVDWQRRHYTSYIRACAQYGRTAIDQIEHNVEGKSPEEVREYHQVFWERCEELSDWDKVEEMIKKGEEKLERLKVQMEIVKSEIEMTRNPWYNVAFETSLIPNSRRFFTEEEDRFLFCMMAKHGYGEWDIIRDQVRKAPEFIFDWFIRSRNAQEIGRRCDTLIKILEKEREVSAAEETQREEGEKGIAAARIRENELKKRELEKLKAQRMEESKAEREKLLRDSSSSSSASKKLKLNSGAGKKKGK